MCTVHNVEGTVDGTTCLPLKYIQPSYMCTHDMYLRTTCSHELSSSASLVAREKSGVERRREGKPEVNGPNSQSTNRKKILTKRKLAQTY